MSEDSTTDVPLPDLSTDDAMIAAVVTLSTLTDQKLRAVGAELGVMAVVWIAVDPIGNSASCIIGGDASAEALQHMADCILGEGYDDIDVTPPRAN